MSIETLLPTVNAALNSLSAALLVSGYLGARRRDVAAHKRFMLGACAVSALFLICYLIRVWLTGTHRFPGSGVARLAYLFILVSHMLLAAVVPVLAARALFLAFRGRIEEHRRLVRYAWPIWLYVSVTGVVVYLMLYHWPV